MDKKNYKNPPVKTGMEAEVEISDIAYGGEGVAKYRDFTIFIPFGIPGDRIKIIIKEVKKNYARGIIKKVIKDSPLFTIPACYYFRRCGGCQWLNIRYEGQMDYKVKILKNMLEKGAGLKNIKINRHIACKEPFYYRNRAQYKLKAGKDKISIGFYRAGSHEVIDIEECRLVDAKINEIIKYTGEFLNSRKREVTVYDEKTGRGYIRYITVRVGKKGGSLITFVLAKNNIRDYLYKFARYIKNRVEGIKGVIANINTEKGNKVFGIKEIVLDGKAYITEKVKNIEFMLGSGTFFQVNTEMLEVLADFTGRHMKKGGMVVDLYGGVGVLCLPFYKKLKELFIVEVNPQSIDMLEETIIRNNIKNAAVINEKAEKASGKLFSENNIDTVVLDPPRKGVSKTVLDNIKKNNVKNVVYISCNPATLARDIKELSDMYKVKEIVPVDLFPHTYHIEIMSYLKLKI